MPLRRLNQEVVAICFPASTKAWTGLAQREAYATGGREEVGAKIVDGLLVNAPNATTPAELRSIAEAGAIICDELFADLVREHAATRQLAEAVEGPASFREQLKSRWYPAAA